MVNQVLEPPTQERYVEPKLDLLGGLEKLDQPWWKSLRQSFHEWRHPEKLPPLRLTSRPVPVRDIWGTYNYKKRGALGSVVAHSFVIAGLIVISVMGARAVKKQIKPEQVTLIAPDISQYMPLSQKKNDVIGGGGGGGDRDKLQAPKGKLPKFAMEQITPPAMVVRWIQQASAPGPSPLRPAITVATMRRRPQSNTPSATA